MTLHCACLSTRLPVLSAESIPVLNLCSARVSEGKGVERDEFVDTDVSVTSHKSWTNEGG